MDELDQFIGTDIWVRVRVKINNRFFYSFVRLLSKDTEQVQSKYNPERFYDETFYRLNEITISLISRNGECHCTEDFMERTLNHAFKISESDIKLLHPLELITTEELFVIVEDD